MYNTHIRLLHGSRADYSRTIEKRQNAAGAGSRRAKVLYTETTEPRVRGIGFLAALHPPNEDFGRQTIGFFFYPSTPPTPQALYDIIFPPARTIFSA